MDESKAWTRDAASIGIEKRARGRVVAQQRYVERQRTKKRQTRIDGIPGRVARFLYGEIADAERFSTSLSKDEKQRIYNELLGQCWAILIGPYCQQVKSENSLK